MEERLKFVARPEGSAGSLEGEQMTAVCREFGISRKTGYKIFNPYKKLGLDGLHDQSRRPLRYANQLPFQMESRILAEDRSFNRSFSRRGFVSGSWVIGVSKAALGLERQGRRMSHAYSGFWRTASLGD